MRIFKKPAGQKKLAAHVLIITNSMAVQVKFRHDLSAASKQSLFIQPKIVLADSHFSQGAPFKKVHLFLESFQHSH
jgi:hypothetical protein